MTSACNLQNRARGHLRHVLRAARFCRVALFAFVCSCAALWLPTTAGAVQQKEWEGLCAALEKPEWLTDPRFRTAAARNANRDERLRLTEEALMNFTLEEATERLDAHQVPNGPIHHPRGKVVNDPQVVHNQLLVTYDLPAAPLPLRQTRPAAKFPATADNGKWLRYGAPILGEHSTEILREAGCPSKPCILRAYLLTVIPVHRLV